MSDEMQDRWVLMKRGLYYRPNANGYTGNINEAWVITEAEADKHVYPHDEPVTKHRAPAKPQPSAWVSVEEVPRYYLMENREGRRYIGNNAVFWRPNSAGYTAHLDKAGLYSEKEARERDE